MSGLDRAAAYTDASCRQPSPVPLDRAPTSSQWVVIAAAWLLQAWAGSGMVCATGTVPGRDAEPWSQPPADLAVCGLPAGPATATVLLGLVRPAEQRPAEQRPAEQRPSEPTRPEAEVTAEVTALLSERIPVPDARAAALLRYLARRLTGSDTDLLRVSTGGDDLHLVQRDAPGRALRLTVAPAPAPDLGTRIACLLTLLSAELWVNNNNPVTFRVWIGARDTADPVAAATGWWTRTREDPPDAPPAWRAVSVEELDLGMYTIVRGSLLDLFDGGWSGIEEWPHVPPDHLSRHLYRDLLDQLLHRTGGPDGPPHLLVTGHLPVSGLPEVEDDEDDFYGTVVFVGPTDVAVLDLDLTC